MHRVPHRLVALVVAAVALVAACSSSSGGSGQAASGGTRSSTTTTAADPYAGFESAQYADLQHWLCHPDRTDDACDGDLDATVVHADGSETPDPYVPAKDPKVDCFYVYPTISGDQGANSDLVPDAGEIGAARTQAARFGSVCRVFAPMYRQVPLPALFSGQFGNAQARATAYGDVLDAFKYYVSHFSDGRPFVLMGHSQGSGILVKLIQEQIDGDPALRDRLVSALLLGATVAVPEGEAVGGTFQHVPLCTEKGQDACVVTWATFAADSPPPANSIFARNGPDGHAGCTNPAALGSDAPAALHPVFPVGNGLGANADDVPTPFVAYPGLLTGQCVDDGEASYLAVTKDPAVADRITFSTSLGPTWGLHLVDANVAQDDLISLVEAQVAAR